jgi:beta-1,4-N-acetylglucosaminyltransferase
MIFVTVGTTHFDDLVREVDRLCAAGAIADRVSMQIGSGKYVPRNAGWVRYLDNLREMEQQADLVICHGGVGSLFELLDLKKNFIAVPNRQLPDDHQAQLLRALESEGCCRCCWNLNTLESLLVDNSAIIPYSQRAGLPEVIWKSLFSDPAPAHNRAAVDRDPPVGRRHEQFS